MLNSGVYSTALSHDLLLYNNAESHYSLLYYTEKIFLNRQYLCKFVAKFENILVDKLGACMEFL
jgi:hypothetical protein